MALLLLAGLGLRIYFLRHHAYVSNDSVLYQEIAQNWLHAHVYGLSTDTGQRPTLIRLPGYPAVLALVSAITDPLLHTEPGTLGSFLPVLWLQILADLGTCWLLASMARRQFGERAELLALALGSLCPFMANYTAVPLTETFTLFTIALAFWALDRWRSEERARHLLLMAAAISFSMLLRPDEGLLAAALLPAMIVRVPGNLRRKLRPAVLCAALIALPFVPWTVRNARTFHVFQPIAPKLASDPGEASPTGFQRWFRTWGIDFADTENAYWNYPETAVQMSDLPPRAFDSPAQRERTAALLEQANDALHYSAQNDAGFAQLARERIAAHPFRYYILLPVARLADMVLRPRIEMLPIDEPWWRQRPVERNFALFYAALNLGYLAVACWGLRRASRLAPVLTWAMCGFVLLRCALLLTLDNAEQRYTLEFFPVLIVLGSAVAARGPGATGVPLRQARTAAE